MKEFFTYTLPNGIRCICKRVKSNVVHCAMTINTGSRDELQGEFGMAHLVEHTLFKGTHKRRAYHINCRLENLGGELNAYTTKEETVVHTTTLKTDCAKAVELITDIVFRSVFPEREVDKEKQVIFDEINLYKDTPSERIYDDFEDLVFSGSALGHNILGSKASLGKMHSAEIRRFVDRTYNTDQMVFSLIGNLSEQAFINVVTRYLAEIPVNQRQFSRGMPSLPSVFEKTIGRNTHQVHCMLGGRAYSLNDERRLPLLLLVNLLGGPSANSLLNTLLREKNGLSYGVDAAYTPYSDSGIVSIYFSCEREKTEQCIELIDRETSRLRQTILTSRKLAVAKKQFLGQFTIAAESNETYMLAAAKSYLAFDEVDNLETVYDKIDRISGIDIAAAANEVFSQMSCLIYR